MSVRWDGLGGVIWDWGDTLMRDIAGQVGPMAKWPWVEAMPGAAEAVEALSFLPVQCVASNATESSSALVAAALERVGLRQHLSHFVTSTELGVAKPDPGFFLLAARVVGVPPASLVAIGNDLRKDILPARSAGMATVWVAAGGRADRRGSADLVVSDLVELARVLRNRGAAPPSG